MRTPINIPIIKPYNIFPLLLFDSYLGVFMRYYMYGVDVMVIYVDVLIFINTIISIMKKIMNRILFIKS